MYGSVSGEWGKEEDALWRTLFSADNSVDVLSPAWQRTRIMRPYQLSYAGYFPHPPTLGSQYLTASKSVGAVLVPIPTAKVKIATINGSVGKRKAQAS